MNKYNIFITAILILILFSLIYSRRYQYNKNIFPPHYYRRFGFAPPYCPFRDQ